MRPRFKDLDDLCSAFDLMTAVVTDHGGDFIHELGHGLGRSFLVGHHHFFGLETMLGGFAFNGVGCQCEWGAHESDEGGVGIFCLFGEGAQNFPNEGEGFVEIDIVRAL